MFWIPTGTKIIRVVRHLKNFNFNFIFNSANQKNIVLFHRFAHFDFCAARVPVYEWMWKIV